MTTAITAWLAITGLLGCLAVIAIWARRVTKARGLSVLAFLLASPVAAVALGAALGHPVPLINGINAPVGHYGVLGAKMIVGQGIYVLIDMGGIPHYYWLPWDKDKAGKLQDAINRAGKDGGIMMDIPPFEWSWDQHQSFQPLPQPKMLPDKPKPEEPMHYERSA